MTTGKGSNFQLTKLAAKYNEIQANGRILSNRRAMEIIWVRIEQLAERIDLNDAPERMINLQRMWRDFREKEADGRELEANLVKRDIDKEFEAVYHDYMAWRQMFDALALHAKMTESEVKIMKDLHAIMTAEDAYELVAKVMAVMLRVLQDDPKKLKEAQFELSRLTDDFSGTGLDRRFGAGSRESDDEAGPDPLDRDGILYPGDQGRSDFEGSPETDGLPEGRAAGGSEQG